MSVIKDVAAMLRSLQIQRIQPPLVGSSFLSLSDEIGTLYREFGEFSLRLDGEEWLFFSDTFGPVLERVPRLATGPTPEHAVSTDDLCYYIHPTIGLGAPPFVHRPFVNGVVIAESDCDAAYVANPSVRFDGTVEILEDADCFERFTSFSQAMFVLFAQAGLTPEYTFPVHRAIPEHIEVGNVRQAVDMLFTPYKEYSQWPRAYATLIHGNPTGSELSRLYDLIVASPGSTEGVAWASLAWVLSSRSPQTAARYLKGSWNNYYRAQGAVEFLIGR